MTAVRMLLATICVTGLGLLAFAQDAAPKRVAPAEAKSHIGETATVCGKVVDTKVPKYGLAGHGKPVMFDLDQPEPNPVFYFIAFGTKEGGPQEAIDTYKGKNVCVSGQIQQPAAGPPVIYINDRSTIQVTPDAKPDAKPAVK